jgi:thiamine biosynthesis lipoprotein
MESAIATYKIETTPEDKNISRYSHQAMATIFEIFIVGEDENYAAQAANSAFNELDRLEEELSFFIKNSDISRINNLSQNEIVTLGPDAFDCLLRCMKLFQQTNGAFDITMRPLFELWKKYEHPRSQPVEEEISRSMREIGLPWLQIIEESHQVRLMNKSIQIDLGGFGKGYAIDVLKTYLEDWEIESGLIHSGQSTVSSFGKNPQSVKWPISISDPTNSDKILKTIDFVDGALSGSGLKKGQHIIDPRLGKPVEKKLAAWAFAPRAGEADALSTAFMVMTSEEIINYCNKYTVSGLTIDNNAENTKHYFGKWTEGEGISKEVI